MMIILSQTNKGEIIYLSYQDSELTEYSWCVDSRGYLAGRYKGKVVRLHSLIAQRMTNRPIPEGMVVDHKDGNKLNCQRDNLRIATPLQNARNKQAHKDGRTCYKGIQFNGYSWYASIMYNGKHETYGPYSEPIAAARKYDEKALEYFGEYARLNQA